MTGKKNDRFYDGDCFPQIYKNNQDWRMNMKWNRFTIKTKTEAEDVIISALADVGVEGVEIQDKQPLTETIPRIHQTVIAMSIESGSPIVTNSLFEKSLSSPRLGSIALLLPLFRSTVYGVVSAFTFVRSIFTT